MTQSVSETMRPFLRDVAHRAMIDAFRVQAQKTCEGFGHKTRGDEICDALVAGGLKSIRETYVAATGDRKLSGRLADCDPQRLEYVFESLDATAFSIALGNAVNRAMIEAYATSPAPWRKAVRVVPMKDFRPRTDVRVGGYGRLPIVNQGAAYLPLPSPPEEALTFAIGKRGGTETITLEAIRNDDVGVLPELPKRLATAAQRTLLELVLDFFRTNPVIYDGLALFHASHGNLGTTALSAVSLMVGFNAMRKQTELGSGAIMGLKPRYLWCPSALEETAVNLFNQGPNKERTYLERAKIEVVPVHYWTDTNDWCVSCDPEQNPTITVGFLDGNEEPEVFLQDAPTSGSLFSDDKLTLKIRHMYAASCVDFRGLFKAVVV